MGKRFTELQDAQIEFISQQKLFFVATAGAEGRINLSPKGLDSLRVLSPNRVIWLNLTGSGNETATHLRENNRMTVMFCAFEGDPLILRLYGHAKTYHPRDPEWADLLTHFPSTPGSRQIFDLNIDLVQNSCGYAVPLMEFKEDREILTNWAEKKKDEGIKDYWEKRNSISLDGKESGILG